MFNMSNSHCKSRQHCLGFIKLVLIEKGIKKAHIIQDNVTIGHYLLNLDVVNGLYVGYFDKRDLILKGGDIYWQIGLINK